MQPAGGYSSFSGQAGQAGSAELRWQLPQVPAQGDRAAEEPEGLVHQYELPERSASRAQLVQEAGGSEPLTQLHLSTAFELHRPDKFEETEPQ